MGNEDKWQKFKDNVTKLYPTATEIINKIETRAKPDDASSSTTCLDRKKLNQMLQEKGEGNLGTQLAKEILIKEHQALIQIYDLKIAGERTKLASAQAQDNEGLAKTHQANIAIYERYKGYIQTAENDFATSYEEAMLVSYVNDLTRGMGNDGGSLTILTFEPNAMNEPDFVGDRDRDTICLYNPGGHFDLLYSREDPICTELQSQNQQATITRNSKQQKEQEERDKLVREIDTLNKTSPDAVSSEIINAILQGKTIQDLSSSSSDFSIDNLKLLKSIYEASSEKTQTKIREFKKASVTRPSLAQNQSTTAPEPQLDAELAYNAAIHEIISDQRSNDKSDFKEILEATKTRNTASQQIKDDGATLSNLAAMAGKSDFIAPLIETLPNSFKAQDTAGNTPLIVSIANTKNQFASDLLAQTQAKTKTQGKTQAQKVDIDINHISEQFGTNALHLAVAKDYVDKDSHNKPVGITNHQLVEKLIDCGADPNIRTTKSRLSALDIAVLRGSERMVSAILESKKINSSTILKAIKDIDEPKDDSMSASDLRSCRTATWRMARQTPEQEANKKLEEICGEYSFKEVENDDVSEEKKTRIKGLLEEKLQELDPLYQATKALKESIQKEVKSIEEEEEQRKTQERTTEPSSSLPTLGASTESDDDKTLKDSLKKRLEEHFLEISQENSSASKICQKIFQDKFKEKLEIPHQDNEFLCFHETTQNIVKFYPILHRDHDKFNYNKRLDDTENYDPKEFTKEKEQEKILNLLKQAKEETSREFQNKITLDDNFFIAVMKVASEKRGIASITDEKVFEQSFEKALREINSSFTTTSYTQGQNLHEIAKFFSAKFQELSGEQNYLTGRDDKNGKINETPRRLFRVCTDENIEKFREKLLGKGAPSNSPSIPSTPRSMGGPTRHPSPPRGRMVV